MKIRIGDIGYDYCKNDRRTIKKILATDRKGKLVRIDYPKGVF